MRSLLGPAVLAVALIIVAGAVQIAALLIPAGLLFFIVGARIAFNHRGAGDRYLHAVRKAVPAGFPSLRPETQRSLDGSIISALGVVLAGLALIRLFR